MFDTHDLEQLWESPSLEVVKGRLDTNVSKIVETGMILPCAGSWTK